jgi:AcrR family transcriptional regulator
MATTRTQRPQLSPRKRPSQARSERTVALLLEAAARVLQERGLEGYTTNAVAERCGVSVGSLYQYFPNKDALMSALVLQAHLRTAHYLDALRPSTAVQPLEEAIEAMVRGPVADAHAAPRLMQVLEFEEQRLPRSLELEAAEEAIHRNVRALLAPHLAGGTTEEQAAEAAHRMIGIVQGVLDQASHHPPRGERLERVVARAVIGYLGPLLVAPRTAAG